ncbi:FadR/GntR family transcriptional regulator [Clostridium sp. Marseille-P299]|uniref:FadR/GntR family transcriptional regulator n=1 Tax=Clostridium sp. Marseille-P299 TaxID=1805477 RepID=UPI0008341B91|nr:FadR/GntR family transcriptional regulator [Clostridium sp. Marseille-P299]
MKDEKTYSNVIQYIKDLVESGKLKEGDKLPTEREMSLDLNLSRNSIREALRTMETLGIIESKQGSGNYLVGNVGKTFKETLIMMLLMSKINYQDINQVRRAIELQAFQIALNNINDEQLQTMNDRLVSLEHAKDDEMIKRDREFHHELVAITKNSVMIAIMEAMADVFEDGISHNLQGMSEKERQKEMLYHKEIAESLQKQDLKAGLRALTKHYDLIDKNLNKLYDNK